jgi:hypothetical protein
MPSFAHVFRVSSLSQQPSGIDERSE